MKISTQIKVLVVTIIIGVAIIVGGYFGIKQYNIFQQQKIEIERQNSEQQYLLLKQQKELEDRIKELEDEPPKTIIKDPPIIQKEDNTLSIIEQWKPRIVHINCKFVYEGVTYGEQSGSGYIWGINTESGMVVLLTNKHLIEIPVSYPDGGLIGLTPTPTSCDIRASGDSQSVTVYYEDDAFIPFAQEDVAIIWIKNPTPYMKSVVESHGGYFCEERAGLGEEILVIGYPEIGDQNDVTVTDGIISGFDGNYYITSAKVEHGNSGGIALLVKDNCYLGIPSYVEVGSIESMARIFDITKLP